MPDLPSSYPFNTPLWIRDMDSLSSTDPKAQLCRDEISGQIMGFSLRDHLPNLVFLRDHVPNLVILKKADFDDMGTTLCKKNLQ